MSSHWNPTTSAASPAAGRSGDGDPLVTCEISDYIATVTINRPRKANSLALAVFRELNAVIARLQSDSAVRAVVVTGAEDRAFSAGADVSELVNMTESQAYEFTATGQFVFDQLENLPQVVIAAIGGVALGGGLELALACDMRIAAEHARFGSPEITLANTPGWGATQRLWPVIGAGRAMHLMLTGTPIDASTALEWGLVSEVVSTDHLMQRSWQLARDIGSFSPAAIHSIKEAVRVGLTGGMDAGLRAERAGVAACCQTAQQRAAVQAFLHRHPMPHQAQH